MSDFVVLQQMIRDTASLPIVDNYARKAVTLTEPQHPNSMVTIAGLPDNVVVIKADAFVPPPLFSMIRWVNASVPISSS